MSTTLIASAAPKTLDEIVNANIKALVAVSGVTGSGLARTLGVSQSAISARLTGARAWQLHDLELVARAFDLAPADLLRPDMTITPAQMLGRGGMARPKGLEPLTF